MTRAFRTQRVIVAFVERSTMAADIRSWKTAESEKRIHVRTRDLADGQAAQTTSEVWHMFDDVLVLLVMRAKHEVTGIMNVLTT